MVDLEAIEKLCGKQTFTAYGSEVLLGSLADEVPALIAEVRALRSERDALKESMHRIVNETLRETIHERDAALARVGELEKALSELLAAFDDVEVLGTPEPAMREVRLMLDSVLLWNARQALRTPTPTEARTP
jgi:uncharacterized coiled-coil DUF342 family protein